METLSSNAFHSSIARRARRERIPQEVTFELSYACNLRCVHCFNPTHSASPKELALPEILRILDETAAIGALDVCFTGGEPTLHPHFFAAAGHARGLGLTFSLNTNATLVSRAAARRLAELGPSGVFVSLYGMSPRTYEAVTGIPGSHAKFAAGLDALVAERLPVILQMPVMDLNRVDLVAARDFARKLGVKFMPSADIYPRQDGDLAPLARRLPPAERLAALSELGAAGTACSRDNGGFIDCDCGKTQFAVTPYGEMNLCTIFPTPKYDLRRGSVRAGWETLKKTVDDAAPNENFECPSCELKTHCRQGRADAWLETGDMSPCLPHYEELARLEKESDAAHGLR